MARSPVMQVALALLLASAARSLAQDTKPAHDPDAEHVGTVTGAIVGVEVVGDAGTLVRRGNGLLVRCDGFLLLPSSLFLAADGKAIDSRDHQITVWLNPGSDHERPIKLGRIRTYFPRDVPYLVIRLDGVHLPAPRVLLPDALHDGDAVQVVDCIWDPATKQFGKPEVHAAKLRAKTKDEHLAPQALPLAEGLENVPPGAVVVGPEGMAIGVVCGSGTTGRADAFTTFSAFNLATNCVTPVPTTDADFAHDADMVAVPAGRVVVPTAILREQPDMGGVRTACVHSFLIDKHEVTNEEYHAFWRSIMGQSVRQPGTHNELYPLGWEVTGVPFGPEASGLPVLGVPLEGAAAYARWMGKRLPTPFEWVLAAVGPRGESDPPAWVDDYLAQRRRLWTEVRQVHQAYLGDHPDLWTDALFVGSRFTLPWIVLPLDFRFVTDWSKRVVDRALERLCADWRDPHTVLPGGSRRFDRTPEGAEDMLFNAWEVVMPPRPFSVQRPSYYIAAQWPSRVPMPNDPWRGLTLSAIAGVDLLPPMSRLMRRLLRGPTDEDLLLLSSLSGAAQLLVPPERMSIGVGWDLQTGATAWMPTRAGLGAAPRPAGLLSWIEVPRRYHQELGREVPLHTTLPSLTSGANLQYCLPVGFRCVR